MAKCNFDDLFKEFIKEEESTIFKALKNSELTKKEFIKKELEKDLNKTEILARIESELEAIEPSKVIYRESDIGGAPEVIYTGSNTPKWLTNIGIRIDKKLLQKTFKELNEGNINIPNSFTTKQKYMEAFLKELDSRLAEIFIDENFKKFDDSSIKIKKLELELKDNEFFLEKTLKEIERLENGQKVKKGERIKFKINERLKRDRDSARREKNRLEKKNTELKGKISELKKGYIDIVQEKIDLGKKLLEQHEKHSLEIHKNKEFLKKTTESLKFKIEKYQNKLIDIKESFSDRKKIVTNLEKIFLNSENGLSRSQILEIRRELGEYKADYSKLQYEAWLNRYTEKLISKQEIKNKRLETITKLHEKEITKIENLFEINELPTSIRKMSVDELKKVDKIVDELEQGSTILSKKMIERLEVIDEASDFKKLKTQQEVATVIKKSEGLQDFIKSEKEFEIKEINKDIIETKQAIENYEKRLEKAGDDSILQDSYLEEIQILKGIIKNKQRFSEKLQKIKKGSLEETMNFIDNLTSTEKVNSDSLIRGKSLEKYMYDSSLGEQNPMYNRMILRFGEQRAKYQNKLLKIMEPISKVLTEARKERSILESSKKSIKEKVLDWAIPEDRYIFDVMQELDPVKKVEKIDKLTPKEKEVVNMLKEILDNTSKELELRKALDNKIDGYLTHIGITTAEVLKNHGFKSAWRNVWKKDLQRLDFGNVADGKGITDYLSAEKFFRFNIERKGGLSYSKDVGIVMGRYLNTVYKKFTLDDIIPEAKLFVDLMGDGQAKKIVNSWLNNKKGTQLEVLGIEQGSRIEKVLNTHKMFFTLKQLGWNAATAAFSPIGVTVSNFINLTGKEYKNGLERKYLNSEKANKILDDNAGILGRNPLLEIKTDFLNDASTPNYMKVINSAWIMLGASMSAGVKTNFLGRLTKAEWESGKVSNKRVGEIMYEMGKHHALPGTNSVIGSTAISKYAMTYKSWAVPFVHSTTRDFTKVIKGTADKRTKARVGKTLGLVLGLSMLYFYMDEKETKKYSVKRAYQEALGQVGAFDPQFWLGSAGVSDLKRVFGIIQNVGTFAEYKTTGKGYTKGELKGINQLIKYMQPGAYRTPKKVIEEWQ